MFLFSLFMNLCFKGALCSFREDILTLYPARNYKWSLPWTSKMALLCGINDWTGLEWTLTCWHVIFVIYVIYCVIYVYKYHSIFYLCCIGIIYNIIYIDGTLSSCFILNVTFACMPCIPHNQCLHTVFALCLYFQLEGDFWSSLKPQATQPPSPTWCSNRVLSNK